MIRSPKTQTPVPLTCPVPSPPDLDSVLAAVEAGLVVGRRHPRLPLTIYNYTPDAAFAGAWDATTLGCRGLVLDDLGNVVMRCMPKFFNYQEHQQKPSLPDIPAGEAFTAYEKLDGSLIQVSSYEGELLVSSRGSFESDQAVAAKDLIESHPDGFFVPVNAPSGDITYQFELIGPSNRIVVSYPQDELVLLGGITRDANKWLSPAVMTGFVQPPARSCLWQVSGDIDLDTLIASNHPNREGYVLVFESGLRVKVKHEDYVLLHKVLTGLTPRRVVEAIFGKTLDELLVACPDEWHDWLREIRKKVNDLWYAYEDELEYAYKRCIGSYADPVDRKTFALAAKQHYPKLMSALFCMLDDNWVGTNRWIERQIMESEIVTSEPSPVSTGMQQQGTSTIARV